MSDPCHRHGQKLVLNIKQANPKMEVGACLITKKVTKRFPLPACNGLHTYLADESRHSAPHAYSAQVAFLNALPFALGCLSLSQQIFRDTSLPACLLVADSASASASCFHCHYHCYYNYQNLT